MDFSFFILIKIGAVYQGWNCRLWLHADEFFVKKPLIRPGNADLVDLSLTFTNLFWIYFIVKFAGIKAIVKDWFGNKAEKSISS